MSEPIHITDAEFEEKVLKSDTPVVVDFWAPWCGPCHMIAPILEEVAKQYAGQLIVAKVNTDENAEWAVRYGVQGIPTLLYVRGGEIVDRSVGAAPKPFILRKVTDLLAAPAAEPANGGAKAVTEPPAN
jgi:thioredoxin 1